MAFWKIVTFIIVLVWLYECKKIETYTDKPNDLDTFIDVIKWQKKHSTGLIINVLRDVYWENCNIVNSVHWPLDDIKKNKQFISSIQKKISFNTPILVYCAHRTCYTSRNAQIELTRQGFKNVYRYVGGMSDWIMNNQPKNGQCDINEYAKCFQHNCEPPYPP